MRLKRTGIGKTAAALALCAVLLFLSGCGDELRPAQLRDGPQFTVAVTEQPDSFNPMVGESELLEEFILLAYDPLWRIDAAGQPVNCLAEDYSLSSDQRTWTVRLRKGVTFSDGTPLTSEDVKYSYETMSLHSTVYGPYCAGISDIRCPDERTVVFTTSYVKGDMQYCPVPILPRGIWSKQSNVRTFENAEMIGTGPFVLEMTELDPQEIGWTFRAREDYFGEPAKIGAVRFVLYATESGASRALSTGEVDAAIGLTDVQMTTLEGVPGVQLIQSLTRASDTWALAFNIRDSVFSIPAMRQMVELCVDRSWMLSMSNGNAGTTGSSFASPMQEYFYTIPNMRAVDTETAKSILYSNGYEDIDSDGLLEDLITRKDLVLRLYTSTADDWAPTAATVLKENLEAIGVSVSWETTEGKVEDVCTPKGDWDMCLIAWRGNVDPVIAADRLAPASGSLTGWENGNFDEVMQQLRQCIDRAEAVNAAGQLQQIVYDDCPYMVLAYRSEIEGIRNDRWSGYAPILESAGGLFSNGTVDGYMAIEPAEAVG